MLDNIRRALIITRREVHDQLRDWRIVLPITILTLIFPFLANFTTSQVLGFVQKYGANLLAERFIPFLLMIVGFFPISISLVIALESFAGETERRSIEPLLSSPLTDGQLYLGKLLACVLTPLLASYLGMVVYMVGVYRTTSWRPEPAFLILIVLLTAVQALVMVSGAVVISTQTTSVRAANLLASFIIIPVALLIQIESVMMLWADYQVLWWAVLAQVILAGLLIRMGISHLNREELLGHEIDVLNLRRIWKVFRTQFSGNTHSVWDWYRFEIPRTLHRLLIPIGCMIILLVAGIYLGAAMVKQVGLMPDSIGLDRLTSIDPQILNQFRQLGFFSTNNVLTIWWHNLRAVTIAIVLGIFTLGVAGALSPDVAYGNHWIFHRCSRLIGDGSPDCPGGFHFTAWHFGNPCHRPFWSSHIAGGCQPCNPSSAAVNQRGSGAFRCRLGQDYPGFSGTAIPRFGNP